MFDSSSHKNQQFLTAASRYYPQLFMEFTISLEIIYCNSSSQNADNSISQPTTNRVQLDLSGIRHLRELELDVTAFSLDDYRHAFFILQKSQHSEEEKRPLYYEYESGALSLYALTSKYINSYKRLESPTQCSLPSTFQTWINLPFITDQEELKKKYGSVYHFGRKKDKTLLLLHRPESISGFSMTLYYCFIMTKFQIKYLSLKNTHYLFLRLVSFYINFLHNI